MDSNGRVESTTRLTISDIPVHLPAAELEDALSQVGCDLRSKVLYEMARAELGNLSRFKTGNRFGYMIVPETPLPKHSPWEFLTPGSFTKSSHVLPLLHIARECINEQVCRTCFGTGHKPGTLPAPWAYQSPPPRSPLLTSLWPLSAQAASQAQRPQLPSLASLLLPASLAPQPAPGLPALDLMSAPSQLQALATVARGHFPHQHQTLRAKTTSVSGLTMWPWNRQRIKHRTQGREFPLLRPVSDPLMTRNYPRTYSFRFPDFKWRLKL